MITFGILPSSAIICSRWTVSSFPTMSLSSDGRYFSTQGSSSEEDDPDSGFDFDFSWEDGVESTSIGKESRWGRGSKGIAEQKCLDKINEGRKQKRGKKGRLWLPKEKIDDHHPNKQEERDDEWDEQ